jgi:hypothetical protein
MTGCWVSRWIIALVWSGVVGRCAFRMRAIKEPEGRDWWPFRYHQYFLNCVGAFVGFAAIAYFWAYPRCVAAGCVSSPPSRTPAPCRPSSPPVPAPVPPRLRPPHLRPPHSRSLVGSQEIPGFFGGLEFLRLPPRLRAHHGGGGFTCTHSRLRVSLPPIVETEGRSYGKTRRFTATLRTCAVTPRKYIWWRIKGFVTPEPPSSSDLATPSLPQAAPGGIPRPPASTAPDPTLSLDSPPSAAAPRSAEPREQKQEEGAPRPDSTDRPGPADGLEET